MKIFTETTQNTRITETQNPQPSKKNLLKTKKKIMKKKQSSEIQPSRRTINCRLNVNRNQTHLHGVAWHGIKLRHRIKMKSRLNNKDKPPLGNFSTKKKPLKKKTHSNRTEEIKVK